MNISWCSVHFVHSCSPASFAQRASLAISINTIKSIPPWVCLEAFLLSDEITTDHHGLSVSIESLSPLYSLQICQNVQSCSYLLTQFVGAYYHCVLVCFSISMFWWNTNQKQLEGGNCLFGLQVTANHQEKSRQEPGEAEITEKHRETGPPA